MRHIELDIQRIAPFIPKEEIAEIQKDLLYQHMVLTGKSGKGNDFLGWVDLPQTITNELLDQIVSDAVQLRSISEVVVVIGIGGSYLGAKAVIESLRPHFGDETGMKGKPRLVYAGHHISGDYLTDLMRYLDGKAFSIVVISKSGTTTEPAIAFRLLKSMLENNVGKKAAKDRIIAITDKARGALKSMADLEGYRTYEIPDDVGGRFSVLTPVGLLPVAIAGFDIRKIMEGATAMQGLCFASGVYEENPAALYAAARNALYRRGKPVEVLANYEPSLQYFSEWWKQLYGESEGKENRGIFPAAVNFTTDLHSMGQYLQEGLRVLFETVISVEKPRNSLLIPEEADNYDGLNFIAGKELNFVNHMAELGTIVAHHDGGVPVMRILLPELNEFYVGELIYFFEFACALSGYVLDVNPFDQPGVEAYKKNMFALLGKKGFEQETHDLRQRLNLL
jgi:glucose-6-phosphate isomerase